MRVLRNFACGMVLLSIGLCVFNEMTIGRSYYGDIIRDLTD